MGRLSEKDCNRKKENVLIVCTHVLQEHPNAIRMLNFGRMLVDDYQVYAVGISYDDKNDLYYEIDEINCCQLSLSSDRSIKQKIEKNIILKNKLEQYVSGIRKPNYIIISASFYDVISKFFYTFAKKNGSKIIQSVCEWYSPKDQLFRGTIGKVKFILNRYLLMIFNVRCKNTICISSLLDRYYSNRRCHSIRITTTVDMKEFDSTIKQKKDKLLIMYAGSPKQKDCLYNMIQGVSLLDKSDREHLIFDIYGVTKQQARNSLGLSDECLDELNETLLFHGRVPHSEIVENLKQADFTVLLRPNERYANAGFPTKVGESMAAGIPVIANATSDLSEYIIHGKTGFICANEQPESFMLCLGKALKLTDKQIYSMKENARLISERYFDYNVYKEALINFLRTCKE